MKKIKNITLCCFFLPAFLLGWQPTLAQIDQEATTEARKAINLVNQQFMQAWKAGNAAGVAALYTEDAVFLAPHAEPVIGREAITKYVQGALNAGLKQIKLETVEFNRFGNIAHERGRYKLFTANGQVVDYGKYMIIWKKQDGDWKIHWDMYNTSRPKAPQPKTKK